MKINSKTLSISLFWSLAEQGGSTVVSLIVQIVLARLLTPEIFGVMAILLVINSLISTIAQGGFGSALIQKKDADIISFSTALWLSIGFACILYLATFFSAPLVASVYSMPTLELYIRVLALTIFLDSFNSIQRAYLQKKMEFKKLFQVNFISLLLGAVTGVILAILGFGVWALIYQVIVQAFTACITMLITIPWKPQLTFNLKEGQNLFSYGWKICATGILNTFYTGLSELIIGKFCNAADLGYYSQGRKWPNAAMAAVNNSLQNVLFPAFSELQDDLSQLQYTIKKALISGFYITSPICILSAILAEPIIYLFLGEAWLPCTLVFQLTCLGFVFAMPQVVNLRAYMALGHSGLYLKLQLIKVISGAIIFCGVALITKNIYFLSLAVFIHAVICVLFVDMHPAKRIIGIGALNQVKIIIPTLVLAAIASIPTIAISAAHIGYIPQLFLQIITFVLIYLTGSIACHHEGLTDCKATLWRLIKRQ